LGARILEIAGIGIGDELMVSGEARRMQEHDPRKVRVTFNGEHRWHRVWAYNKRIATLGERGDFQEYAARVNGLRPYTASKSAQRWTWREYRPPPGEIYLNDFETDFGRRHAGRIVLEPTIKRGAPPGKDWGWIRWNKLAWIFEREGVRVTQLGPIGTRILDGSVEHIVTSDFRAAAAVLANARGAVVHEGGQHHAAAALGLPAVVIFGGYISPAVTGYEMQTNFFTGDDLGCGMRIACEHCRAAMARIEPEQVARSFLRLLNG
jgi:hypothetical protein